MQTADKLNKALVGDEVYICAEISGIADGTSVKIKIVEKDDDGNDDDVEIISGTVKGGKIECKWKVIYTADEDDSNSQKEKEDKGYTLPEYAFTIECNGIVSEESGQLDVTDWIKAVAKFDDSHSELCNKEYIILKTDGTKILGRTNSIGNIEEYDLGFGSYFIGMKWEKNENE